MSMLEQLPPSILSRIVGFVIHSPGREFPSRESLIKLSTVSRIFRAVVRPFILNSVSINSLNRFSELLKHFRSQQYSIPLNSAIKKLTLHWDRQTRVLAPTRFPAFFALFWISYGRGIQELELDFPRAASYFEDTVRHYQIRAGDNGGLKKLVLRHAGEPLIPPPKKLFHALSYFAHHCLEELVLDGACSVLVQPWLVINGKLVNSVEFYKPHTKLFIPTMDRLVKLEIVKFPGITAPGLIWLLSGEKMKAERGTVLPDSTGKRLVLELNPHIAAWGISYALKAIGKGLDDLKVVYFQRMLGFHPIQPFGGVFIYPEASTNQPITQFSHVTDYLIWRLSYPDLVGGSEEDYTTHLCNDVRVFCPHLKRLWFCADHICRLVLFEDKTARTEEETPGTETESSSEDDEADKETTGAGGIAMGISRDSAEAGVDNRVRLGSAHANEGGAADHQSDVGEHKFLINDVELPNDDVAISNFLVRSGGSSNNGLTFNAVPTEIITPAFTIRPGGHEHAPLFAPHMEKTYTQLEKVVLQIPKAVRTEEKEEDTELWRISQWAKAAVDAGLANVVEVGEFGFGGQT
ncbi:hypothetical protein RUND412_005296 [Rhizina undulata]